MGEVKKIPHLTTKVTAKKINNNSNNKMEPPPELPEKKTKNGFKITCLLEITPKEISFMSKRRVPIKVVRASRHDQRIEWSGSPQRRTRMATTKQQKLLQLKKKNPRFSHFFKKIQLFMSVERK